MSNNRTDRKDYREDLGVVLAAALVGTGKPVDTFKDHLPISSEFDGRSPFVCMASAGSDVDRQTRTLSGKFYIHYINILVFVARADTAAEDTLDDCYALIADTLEANKSVSKTNYIINPSFEVNITDGWTELDSGTGAVFTRGVSACYYGIGNATITAGNAASYFKCDQFTLADGLTTYAHCQARSVTTTDNARMYIRDATNGVTRANAATTVANVWEKLAANWTNTTGGPVVVEIWIWNNATDGASIVYFDTVAAFITLNNDYFDGTTSGCHWTGTANNSTSVCKAWDSLEQTERTMIDATPEGWGGQPYWIETIPVSLRGIR